MENKDYFDFLLDWVKETAKKNCEKEPQAFIRWFINMYFIEPQDIYISDGSRDGKIDAFFKTLDDDTFKYYVINSKYTKKYNKIAPSEFYDEIVAFYEPFKNKSIRGDYIERKIKPELKPYYEKLFEAYDNDNAELIFLTNYKKNSNKYALIDKLPIITNHLEDLIQFISDDIDGAMPITAPLKLYGINSVLNPEVSDSRISNVIVFARLIDFINYMKKDKFDLLFARNVRVGQGNTQVNKEIRETFKEHPEEFVFSNNGITLLCDKWSLVQGGELQLVNPRVVNGAQTLYSIREVANPSDRARVMVRIIQIPQADVSSKSDEKLGKKQIINKISIRSNFQNPIKKWDLVSQDDFQLKLYRYFRGKRIFYERRKREWNHKSRTLKSLGFKRGPNIRRMAQLIASYYWDNKKLGPAIAKLSVSKLFESPAYDNIIKAPIDLCYKIYLLSRLYDELWNNIFTKKFSKKIGVHFYFAVYSLIVKTLGQHDILDNSNLYKYIEDEKKRKTNLWEGLIRSSAEYIYRIYKMEDRKYKKREKTGLTLNNFFKSSSYMNIVLSKPITPRIKKIAKEIAMLLR